MGSELFMTRTDNNAIIVGRNSKAFCCKEIVYFPASSEGTIKLKNIEVIPETAFAYIVNGTCGANEKNVTIAMLFADKKTSNGLTALDLTKLALERSESAEKAVEVITQLINQYNSDDDSVENSSKYGFFICDFSDVFVLDMCGKMWAAEKVVDTFRAFGNSFSVKTKIDKKSEGLEDKLKDLGLLEGDQVDFSSAFNVSSDLKWPCEEPDSGFSAQKMFQVLRSSSSSSQEEISSSFVSVLKEGAPCVYWFTGTPNPSQSVFKPFIFTTNARISPLTAMKSDEEDTVLRELHKNCNWDQVGDLLQSLEKSCVDEIDGGVAPLDDELDELLKDCVEAEVKFYR